ncbi:hypothetical protein [Parachlamydia sp. AcF125]|uniref:hypothetical protein n=1 Tax=Parachlamydia sp. AcF125 TaxID=2795736 RepID=UPI001BC952B9|nr:hypothetical protein [Parachlamydia sp. AcF125]MBS4168571.1 hypothetical protein [Parachlamydia sp. AcF125]
MQVDNFSQVIVPSEKSEKAPLVHLKEKANAITLVQRHALGTVEALVPTHRLGERLKIFYIESEKTVEAFVIDKSGKEIPILQENMPKELRLINSALAFQAFLKGAYFKTSSFSNGELGLYVGQRGKGGGDNEPAPAAPKADEKDLAMQTMKLIREGQEELAQKKIKEKAILFVGRTGSGKSLLCNYLNDIPIAGIPAANGAFVFDPSNPIVSVSHSNTRSCTTVPGAYSPLGKDFTYADLSGFGDTKGAVQDIVNAFTRAEVIKRTKALKIVIVLQYPDIINRGTDFPNTLNELMQFMGCCKDKEGRKKIVDSIALVVTKVKAQQGIEELEREIQDLLEDKRQFLENEVKWAKQIRKADAKIQKKQEKLRQLRQTGSPLQEVKRYLTKYLEEGILPEDAREIVRYIIDKEKFTIFSAPQGQGAVGMKEEKQKILELIHQKSVYLSKGEAKIQVKVPAAHSGVIQKAITSHKNVLKRHFSPKLLKEIQISLAELFKTSSNEDAVRKLAKRLQEFPQIQLGLADYAANINRKIGLTPGILKEAQQHDLVLKFLTELLPKADQESYCYKENWYTELNYALPLTTWKNLLDGATKPSTLITTKSNRLILKGFFPRTSQIKNELAKSSVQGIPEILILALHTVIVDEDLTDKLNGVNLIIIAPRWDIRANNGKRIINLTGSAGKAHPQAKAAHGQGDGGHGEDGLAGLSGESGGHFFGVGDVFVGLENLQILTNGGAGGKGQDGGDGAHGQNGHDATVRWTFEGWDHYGSENKTGAHTTDQLCESYGKAGTPGGNAGAGGQGGLGGLAGTAEIVSLSGQVLKYQKEAEKGLKGQDGGAGRVGQGGYNGRNAWGTWHRGGNPDNGWNGHAHEQPQLRGTSAPPVSGKAPPALSSKGLTNPKKVNFNVNAKLLEYRCYLAQQLNEANEVFHPAIEAIYNKYESNSALKDKANLSAFIEESQKIEDLFAKMGGTSSFLPLYRSLLQRIEGFAKRATLSKPEDIKVLQYLYTSALSRICQLEASRESRLIIDIKAFLEQSVDSINKLSKLEKNKLIEHYRKEYETQIAGKIEEAEKLIQLLKENLTAATRKIDDEIKTLLNEIDQLKANAEGSKAKLAVARDRLKEQMKKKMIMGVLSITAQGIGALFPPAGPIVASLAVAGLNIASNPSGWASELNSIGNSIGQLDALINKKKGSIPSLPADATTLDKMKDFAQKMKPVAEAGKALLDQQKSDQAKVNELEAAITDAERAIKALQEYQGNVAGSFKNSLHQLEDQAKHFQDELKTKSLVAIDFSMLEIKKFFEAVRHKIKIFTQGFAAGEGFIHIFQQMEEAIETSMTLYSRIHAYRDQATLANYMAHLHSAGVQGIQITEPKHKEAIDRLDRSIQRNIVLGQYGRAVGAVQQWAFPFAHEFFKDFANLKQYLEIPSDDACLQLMTTKLRSLKNRVAAYYSEINKNIDDALIEAQFSGEGHAFPFYIWRGHTQKLEKLLQGKNITLSADVNNALNGCSAVKFSNIGIKIKCSSLVPTDKREELERRLKGCKVYLRHSGYSYYKYNNTLYSIPSNTSFELMYAFERDRSTGKPIQSNSTYGKMSEGNLMLSPYTRWEIELESLTGGSLHLAEIVKDYLKEIEIQLVGKGTYVDEARMKKNAAELQLDRYYQDASVIASHSLSAPSPVSSSADKEKILTLEEQNAFNQSHVYDYWYQATDIHAIQAELFKNDSRDFHILQPIGAGELNKRRLDEIKRVIEQKPVLGVYNIADLHWVAFCLIKDKTSGKITVLYKDSLGQLGDALKKIFERNDFSLKEFKSNQSAEQRGDSSSCGILALENVRIMINQLRGPNQAQFIAQFNDFSQFCKLDRAKYLRTEEFPRCYVYGVHASMRKEKIQAQQSKEIRKHHQQEVDEIANQLRQNSSKTVKNLDADGELNKQDEKETIAIEIGLDSFKFKDGAYNYHYRIYCTNDMTIEWLKLHLLSFNFLGIQEADYKIENNVIKISSDKVSITKADKLNKIATSGNVDIQELFDRLNISSDTDTQKVRGFLRN